MNAKHRVTAYGQEFSEQQILGTNNYHQSLVDSGQFTEEEVSKAWEKAKQIANDNADENPDIVPSYAYTTGIFQDLLGLEKVEASLKVNAATRLTAALRK